jgi:hypothetical protein
MTTRKRTKRDRTSSKSSTEASTSVAKEKGLSGALSEAPDHVTRSDLPPSRPRKEILTPVAPPGQKAPLHYFIYTLVTASLLFAGWYTYITAVGLKQWKDEVGWWGMTVGRSGRQDNVYRGTWGGGQEVKGDFEEHLSRLASALGIPATDVASAIKPFVPPATLSSLAPQATGEAMKVFFEEDLKRDRGDGSRGTMGSAAESLRKVVGFDDPLEEVGL